MARPAFLGTRASAAERSRRKFARRQWARRWLVWRYVVAFVVVCGLAGTGVYFVYFSDTLAVQAVDVVGTRTLDPADVETRAAVPRGGPLATVDLQAIERRVEASFAEVLSVDATREWPHSVRISVTERQPVAVVADGDGTLRSVDVEGELFGSYRRVPAGLPRIDTDITDKEALLEAVTVIAALPDEVTSVVDHLELSSADQVDLYLTGAREVRWGSSDASEQKGEVLLALLGQPGSVYDVSVPGQPTVSG